LRDHELSAKLGRKQHASLRVHLSFRAQVDGVELNVLGSLGICHELFQNFLSFQPDRKRIYSSYGPVETRNKQRLVLQILLEANRELQTPLVVQPARIQSFRRGQSRWLTCRFHFVSTC